MTYMPEESKPVPVKVERGPVFQPAEKKFLGLLTGLVVLIGVIWVGMGLFAVVNNSNYPGPTPQFGSLLSSLSDISSTKNSRVSNSNSVSPEPNSQIAFNLPVAVYPAASQAILRPEQQRNANMVAGLTKLAGLSNVEYLAFTTGDSKDKVVDFYQNELRAKGYQIGLTNGPNDVRGIGGTKVNFSGVSVLSIGVFDEKTSAQLIQSDIKGKTVIVISWAAGNFSDLMGS